MIISLLLFNDDNHCGQIQTIEINLPNFVAHVFCSYSAVQPGLCEQPITYNGEACSSELQYWQECFSQQPGADIYLPSNIDPEQVENKAKRFFFGLSTLSPSPECVTELRPFLCLYLFGSCDSNNQSRQVTQDDCERLRDDVCAREWKLAEKKLGRNALPQCGNYPSKQKESCPSKGKWWYKVIQGSRKGAWDGWAVAFTSSYGIRR